MYVSGWFFFVLTRILFFSCLIKQLAPWHNNSNLIGGFPSLRWQQTANLGAVPNAILPNVFMAVAMDLPDFDSPYIPYDRFYIKIVVV